MAGFTYMVLSRVSINFGADGFGVRHSVGLAALTFKPASGPAARHSTPLNMLVKRLVTYGWAVTGLTLLVVVSLN